MAGCREFQVPGPSPGAEKKNLMKHKLSITGQAPALVITASLLVTGTAFAQNPSLFYRKPSVTPAPAAQAGATNKKSQNGGSVSSADRAFASEAAKGGMMEVAMGRQAEQNASNPEVKRFGARMVTDHSKANSELKSIASSKGIELPTQKEPGKWKSDKDYMDGMVKDHEKDLADFEKQAKNGSDPDLKSFADKTSAVIRKHLDLAKEVQGKLK
jgi:Predicted outer membrane protein